ncbi:MAG: hypothetical protein ACTSXZ_05395, partial [Alphaproteobacteria bacterium]
MGRLFGLSKRKNHASPAFLLQGGRLWTPTGLREGDLLLRDGIISEIGKIEPPAEAVRIDLHGLLVTPGLIDAQHPLDEDCLPPLAPGPFTDWHRREEMIMREQPPVLAQADAISAEERVLAGVLNCLRNGVTTAVSPVS